MYNPDFHNISQCVGMRSMLMTANCCYCTLSWEKHKNNIKSSHQSRLKGEKNCKNHDWPRLFQRNTTTPDSDQSWIPQRQSKFTPKMKANTVPHLLSSLVWIDQYNECNGMTSFMEFMSCVGSEGRDDSIIMDVLFIQHSQLLKHATFLMRLKCSFTKRTLPSASQKKRKKGLHIYHLRRKIT